MRKKVTVKKKQESLLEPDSPEYRIAAMQLYRLEQIAKERLFTKEEATIYDVLCRNLKLAKEGSTEITGEYSSIDDVESRDLLDFMKQELEAERKKVINIVGTKEEGKTTKDN